MSDLYQILIPSCKNSYDLAQVIIEICRANQYDANQIIYTCRENSAAVNRNICLGLATSEYVIMVDDDITGFAESPHWAQNMILPMIKNENILYVSARLLNEDGSPQMCIGFSKDIFKVPLPRIRIAPAACIAFRNDGTRFNEKFKGGGIEDVSFHHRLKDRYPDKYPVVNNAVRLIHKNEKKNQQPHFEYNRKVLEEEFPGRERILKI